MTPENLQLLEAKKKALYENLSRYPSLGVAFSGGVDSSFLLAVARHVLGHRVVAMTGQSPIHPSGEKEAAIALAKQLGVRHILFDTHELDNPDFVRNGHQRCYHCKLGLLQAMQRIAQKQGIAMLAHGANVDDLSDFRPGFQAAQEMGVAAPLVDVGLTKVQIRELARQMGLSNWDRPAMACLATRIGYGIIIDRHLLDRIDRAERVLRNMGITACRVRHHDHLARIEVAPSQLPRLIDPQRRKAIVQAFQKLGYHHIALDLEGYISGKMNRGVISGDE